MFFRQKSISEYNLDLHKAMMNTGNGISEGKIEFIFSLLLVTLKDD